MIARERTAQFAWVPNPGPQTDAYFSPADELFYGGQSGGGKTDLGLGLALTAHRRSPRSAPRQQGRAETRRTGRRNSRARAPAITANCNAGSSGSRRQGRADDRVFRLRIRGRQAAIQGRSARSHLFRRRHRFSRVRNIASSSAGTARPIRSAALPRRGRLEPADHGGGPVGDQALGAMARSAASAPGAARRIALVHHRAGRRRHRGRRARAASRQRRAGAGALAHLHSGAACRQSGSCAAPAMRRCWPACRRNCGAPIATAISPPASRTTISR